MALLVQKAYGVNCSLRRLKDRGETGTIEGRTVTLNPQWALTFRKEMRSQSVAHIDGSKVYTPYRSKVKVAEDTVYNISVADDESYICNNRVVHNCTSWSIAKAGHGPSPNRPLRRNRFAVGLRGLGLFAGFLMTGHPALIPEWA